MTKKLLQAALISLVSFGANAQDFLGMSTSNYAGITGVHMQPASIADSRLKFDLNFTSFNVGFKSNFIGFDRTYAVNNRGNINGFSSFYDFRNKSLSQTPLAAGTKGFANITNTWQVPLSFMLTTSKKSAIALNIRSRTAFAVNNMPSAAADLFFKLQDSVINFNQSMNADSLSMNGVSWLDVGLTYARVLVNSNKHFLKAGITGKYIGGLSSFNFEADKLNIYAGKTDSVVMNSGTSYVKYSHSPTNFNVKPENYRPDASSFGFDAGIVYEFRGRVSNFKLGKYTESGELVTKMRRDKNKYSFRIGASLLDVGQMNFTSSDRAKDFRINQTVNFPDLARKVNSVESFDNYIDSNIGVTYKVGAPAAYSIALPTAYNVQIDLHILRGLYVNGMFNKALTIFNPNTTYRTFTREYIAVTPRLEGRFAGLYVPVVRYNEEKDWRIGTTLRVGPVFAGTNNLATLFKSTSINEADVHLGFKLGLGFGRASKAFEKFNQLKKKIADAPSANTDANTSVKTTTDSKTNTELNTNTITTKEVVAESKVMDNSELEAKLRAAELKLKEAEETITELEKANKNNTKAPTPTKATPAEEKMQTPPQPVKIIINNYNSPKGGHDQDIEMEGGADGTNNELDELRRKIEQKEKMLEELKKKDKSTGCIDTKKKIASLKAIANDDNYENAMTPTGNGIFASNAHMLKAIEDLKNRNNAVNTAIAAQLSATNTELGTVSVNSAEEACLLWKKNELLALQLNGKDKPTSKQITKKVIIKKTIQEEPIGPIQQRITDIQRTENTVYYKPDSNAYMNRADYNQMMKQIASNKPDSSAYMNRADYTQLMKEIASLRKDVAIYRDLAAKNEKNVQPIIVKRPLFGARAKQEGSNEEAMQIAIAKLRKELKPTIIRDTITIEKIVEKPTIQYVDKIVERVVDRPTVQYVDKVVERVVDRPIEKIVTKMEQLLSLPPDVILFDVAKSNVKAQYNSRLSYYATQLKKFADLQVTLHGFTDNTGNAASNKRLSEARANAVKAYLLVRGVLASQINTDFSGADAPISDNNSATNKSQNRRVEISFNK